MRRVLFSLSLLAALASPAIAQRQAVVAQPAASQPKVDASAARFGAVLHQALSALAQAGSYSLDVESQWGAVDDPQGPHGGSRYRLIWQGGKYRVEVQSPAAESPELVCVNDGSHVTTLFPARGLYSRHATASPQVSLEANKMLNLSLQGSAIDILLQTDVAGTVGKQVSDLRDHGQTTLDGRRAQHFELLWAGANVQLWFAAEGAPLLLQFTRTTCVPTSENESYVQTCTAKFQWKLGTQPAADAFRVSLPKDARQVNEIYAALAGDEAAAHIGQPLPKLTLSKLDGSEVELAADPDKKATVLILWATWCASSIEDLPAVSELVKAYKDRGIAFYAINVGEQPGEVRRFTAKSPLASTVLLDPRSRSSAALRIIELPAVVIVAPDNTVRSILHGAVKKLPGEIAGQLDALLNSSAKTARRPGETTGRQK